MALCPWFKEDVKCPYPSTRSTIQNKMNICRSCRKEIKEAMKEKKNGHRK